MSSRIKIKVSRREVWVRSWGLFFFFPLLGHFDWSLSWNKIYFGNLESTCLNFELPCCFFCKSMEAQKILNYLYRLNRKRQSVMKVILFLIWSFLFTITSDLLVLLYLLKNIICLLGHMDKYLECFQTKIWMHGISITKLILISSRNNLVDKISTSM